MRRLVAVVLGSALALMSIAAAPPPAAKPGPAPAAKPGTAPQTIKLQPPPKVAPLSSDDPAKVALAKQFLIAYHPRLDMKNVKMVLDNFIPRAVEQYKKRDPKFDAKKYEAETRDRVMKGAVKKVELQSHIVSRHFSMQELKDLNAFFRGPLGSKLIAETPKIQIDMLKLRRSLGEQTKGSSYQKDSGDDEDEDEDDAPAKKPAPAKPAPAKPQSKK